MWLLRLFARLYEALFGLRDQRILMLGLDAAGKTTVLYKLHLNEVVHTVATIGFNVERVTYKRLDLTIWDVGGQEKLRRLWRHYYANTDALIFVLDAADTARLEDARQELVAVLSDGDMDSCRNVLVLANKQDLPGAESAAALVSKLGLQDPSPSNVLRHRTWYVQACCARTGEGLFEGFDWLAGALRRTAASNTTS